MSKMMVDRRQLPPAARYWPAGHMFAGAEIFANACTQSKFVLWPWEVNTFQKVRCNSYQIILKLLPSHHLYNHQLTDSYKDSIDLLLISLHLLNSMDFHVPLLNEVKM